MNPPCQTICSNPIPSTSFIAEFMDLLHKFSFKDKLAQANFSIEPFPHWHIPNFFPRDLYQYLVSNLPSSKDIHHYSNHLSDYEQNTSYRLELPTANSLYHQLDALFDLWSEERTEILEFIKSLPLDISTRYSNDVLLHSFSRADFRASSPVNQTRTTQLGPHCDNPKEVFAGLVYLRYPNDTSFGGDLDLFELRESSPSRFMSNNRRIPGKFIQLSKTIRYAENSAVFFIPTEYSIHGVSIRNPTNFERRLINLSIELPLDLPYSMWNVSDFSFHQDPFLLKKILNKIRYRNNFANYSYISADKI